jgi:hypothetical protein
LKKGVFPAQDIRHWIGRGSVRSGRRPLKQIAIGN